jgi:hypothetical protein
MKALECILSYLLAAGVFGTFVFLTAEKGWDWKFILLGLFSAFLMIAFTKIEMTTVQKEERK